MKQEFISVTILISTIAIIICFLLIIVYLFKRNFKFAKNSFVFLAISAVLWVIAVWNLEDTEEVTEDAAAYEKVVDYEESINLVIKDASYDSATGLMTVTAQTDVIDGTEVSVLLTHVESRELTVARGVAEAGEVTFLTGDDEYMENGSYKIHAYIQVNEVDNLEFSEHYGNEEKVVQTVEIVEGSLEDDEESKEGVYSIQFKDQGPFEISGAYSSEEIAQKEQEKKVKQAQEKKENAQELRFAELNKNPDKHAGTYIKYQGEILQIMEDETSTDIRLAVTKDSYGYDYNDVVYVTFEGTTPFLDEDIVTIYGKVSGAYSYESTAGYQITLPLIEAEFIE